MVKAIKGCLLECDAAMKQLLLKMNAEGKQFIIEDLDETHLLVDPAHVAKLKEQFAEALEENVYKLETEVKSTF